MIRVLIGYVLGAGQVMALTLWDVSPFLTALLVTPALLLAGMWQLFTD